MKKRICWPVGVGWVMLVACGPQLRDAGSDADTGASSSSEGTLASAGATTTASTTGADASGPGQDDTGDATSTGAELPPAFLGQWICDGYSQPIHLVVDAYEPTNQPTGQACIADGDDSPPPRWTRCAMFSPHPINAPFWVMLDFGGELVLDLSLFHDLELDELDGNIRSFDGELDVPAHCERYGR